MNENEKFLRTAIEQFGNDKQMVVCIEEMAELTQQLSKIVIEHPNKDREKVVEEMADVEIMLNQVKIILEIDELELERYKRMKLERLKGIIQP